MLVLTVPFSCVKEELAGSELCHVYVFCHCTPRRPDTLSISLQRAALEKKHLVNLRHRLPSLIGRLSL